MATNSEIVKSSTDFLKHENKKEYNLVKGGKNMYNFSKENLSNISHSPVVDFFINPINTYSERPFNGSSNFYIDFQLPKIEYLYHQFILRFRLTNTSSTLSKLMPGPLLFEKVCLLKNSNSLGNDVTDFDILLFNLNKILNELNNNNYRSLGMTFDSNNYLTSFDYMANGDLLHNIELPVSLDRSEFPSCCVANDLILRCYLKNNIVYDGCQNSDIILSGVVLALRMKEMSCENKAIIYKQPKLNYIFNKRVIQKYNLNSLSAGLQYSVNLSGFKNCASCALVYITNPDNNISYSSLGNKYYHIMGYQMTDVFITNSTGQNVVNNIKFDYDYNQYLILNKFKRYEGNINYLTQSKTNNGEIYYLPFCSEKGDPFENAYSGGLKFDGDFKLNFTSVSNSSHNVILNVMFFVPALLDLTGGDLKEILS